MAADGKTANMSSKTNKSVDSQDKSRNSDKDRRNK